MRLPPVAPNALYWDESLFGRDELARLYILHGSRKDLSVPEMAEFTLLTFKYKFLPPPPPPLPTPPFVLSASQWAIVLIAYITYLFPFQGDEQPVELFEWMAAGAPEFEVPGHELHGGPVWGSDIMTGDTYQDRVEDYAIEDWVVTLFDYGVYLRNCHRLTTDPTSYALWILRGAQPVEEWMEDRERYGLTTSPQEWRDMTEKERRSSVLSAEDRLGRVLSGPSDLNVGAEPQSSPSHAFGENSPDLIEMEEDERDDDEEEIIFDSEDHHVDPLDILAMMYELDI